MFLHSRIGGQVGKPDLRMHDLVSMFCWNAQSDRPTLPAPLGRKTVRDAARHSLAGSATPGNMLATTNVWAANSDREIRPELHAESNTSSVLETSCSRAVRYDRISSLVLSWST